MATNDIIQQSIKQLAQTQEGRALMAAIAAGTPGVQAALSQAGDAYCASKGYGAAPKTAYIPAAAPALPAPGTAQIPSANGAACGTCTPNPTAPTHHAANAYQNGFPSTGSCCGSCASGGSCSCSGAGGCGGGSNGMTGQACSGDDRVFPPVSLASAPGCPPCEVPPGFFNCESTNGEIAPCQVERIANTRRRFSAQGDTAAGTLVAVTSDAFLDNVPTIVGYTWYRLVISEIGVSHDACVRDLVLTLTPDGGAAAVDATDTIEAVTLQSEYIYQDGNGNYVRAWDWPRIAQAEDIRITDGRCACECLCVCVPARADIGVAVLVPNLAAGANYTLTVRGLRNSWQKSCGPCPPELLCGRELVA